MLLSYQEVEKRISNRLNDIEEELNYLPKYIKESVKHKPDWINWQRKRLDKRGLKGNKLESEISDFEKQFNPKKQATECKKWLQKEKKALIKLKKEINSKNYFLKFITFLLTNNFYNVSRNIYFYKKEKIKYQGRVRYFMTHDVAGCCNGVTLTDDMVKEIFFPCKCSKMNGALTVFNSYMNSKKKKKLNEFRKKELQLMLKELLDDSDIDKKKMINTIQDLIPFWKYYKKEE